MHNLRKRNWILALVIGMVSVAAASALVFGSGYTARILPQSGSTISKRTTVGGLAGHEVFIEAVSVPDVSAIMGSTFNFTVVIKNPNNATLLYRPDLIVSVYNRTDNHSIYTRHIPLNTSFTLLPHRVTTVYNGTLRLGKGAIGNSYWLTATSPSTEKVKVVSERIMVSLLTPNAS